MSLNLQISLQMNKALYVYVYVYVFCKALFVLWRVVSTPASQGCSNASLQSQILLCFSPSSFLTLAICALLLRGLWNVFQISECTGGFDYRGVYGEKIIRGQSLKPHSYSILFFIIWMHEWVIVRVCSTAKPLLRRLSLMEEELSALVFWQLGPAKQMLRCALMDGNDIPVWGKTAILFM